MDRKRARQVQVKKREDLSDLEDDEDSPSGRKGLTSSTPGGSGLKKKRKRGKVKVNEETRCRQVDVVVEK